MNKFKLTIDGNKYDVTVNETDKNKATVEVNGISYAVEYENNSPVVVPVAPKTTAPAAAPQVTTAPKPSGGGADSIKAPLPGTILTIQVTVGASVKRGDVLIVMEAMKMENNILANKDGVVKAIHVTTGQTVTQGDALLDVE